MIAEVKFTLFKAVLKFIVISRVKSYKYRPNKMTELLCYKMLTRLFLYVNFEVNSLRQNS